VFYLVTNITTPYDSMSTASNALNVRLSNIYNYLKGKGKRPFKGRYIKTKYFNNLFLSFSSFAKPAIFYLIQAYI
jgi:hypothetical protein